MDWKIQVHRDDKRCEEDLRQTAQTSKVHPEYLMQRWHTAEWAMEEIDSLRAELSRLTLSAAESQREVERVKVDLDIMGCICQGCNSNFTLDVSVSDTIWNRIRPKGKAEGAGLLCPQCIADRLEVAAKVIEERAEKAEAERDKYKAALEMIADYDCICPACFAAEAVRS